LIMPAGAAAAARRTDVASSSQLARSAVFGSRSPRSGAQLGSSRSFPSPRVEPECRRSSATKFFEKHSEQRKDNIRDRVFGGPPDSGPQSNRNLGRRQRQVIGDVGPDPVIETPATSAASTPRSGSAVSDGGKSRAKGKGSRKGRSPREYRDELMAASSPTGKGGEVGKGSPRIAAQGGRRKDGAGVSVLLAGSASELDEPPPSDPEMTLPNALGQTLSAAMTGVGPAGGENSAAVHDSMERETTAQFGLALSRDRSVPTGAGSGEGADGAQDSAGERSPDVVEPAGEPDPCPDQGVDEGVREVQSADESTGHLSTAAVDRLARASIMMAAQPNEDETTCQFSDIHSSGRDGTTAVDGSTPRTECFASARTVKPDFPRNPRRGYDCSCSVDFLDWWLVGDQSKREQPPDRTA